MACGASVAITRPGAARRRALASSSIRFDSTSSATWRSASSRSDWRFSIRKKFCSARLDPLLGVDLAGAQPLEQRLGGEVDQHDLVGPAEHGVGHDLADPGPGQLGDVVVEALEVLDVHRREDVDSGGEHLVDVLVALRVLEPGALVWASSSIRASSGARASTARRSISSSAMPPYRRAARDDLEAIGLGDRLGAVVRLEVADHDVAAGLGLGLALLEHAVGLADAGRHPEEDLVAAASLHRRPRQAPSRLWTTRSISLIPMNGAIRPPRP